MNRIKQIYLPSALLIILLGMILYRQLAILPPAEEFETSTADVAINFLQTGSYKTDMWGNTIPYASVSAQLKPPVYSMLVSSGFFLGGGSLVSLRTISLILSIMTIAVISLAYLRMGNHGSMIDTGLKILMLALLISNPDFLFGAGTGSGESAAVLMLVCAVAITSLALNPEKPHPKMISAFSAGLLMGLAVLSDYFAVIPAIFFTLGLTASQKDAVASVKILFCQIAGFTAAALPVLTYFSFTPEIFFTQAKLVLAGIGEMPQYLHKIYLSDNFLHITVWSLLAPLTLFLIFYSGLFKKNPSLILILIASWMVLFIHRSQGSTYYVVVFLTVCSLEFISYLKTSSHGILKSLTGLLLFVLFAAQISSVLGQDTLGQIHKLNIISDQMRQIIPAGSSVYLSTVPDFYFELKKSGAGSIYHHPGLFIEDNRLRDLLDKADYIVIDPDHAPSLHGLEFTQYLYETGRLYTAKTVNGILIYSR